MNSLLPPTLFRTNFEPAPTPEGSVHFGLSTGTSVKDRFCYVAERINGRMGCVWETAGGAFGFSRTA